MNSSIKHTLGWLKKRGLPCVVLEKFVKPPKCKFGWNLDLWGSDVQAIVGSDTLNIQCAIGSEGHSTKIRKAFDNPDVRAWLTAPTRKMWIMTWSKRVVFRKNGTKAKLPKWTPRASEIFADGTVIELEI